MKHPYLAALKRAFVSRWFLLAVLGTCAMSFFCAHDYMTGPKDENCSAGYIIDVMLGLGMFKKVLVFFAAVPFASVFCQDYNSGFLNSVLTRTGEKHYIFSGMISCVLSGFCAVFCGMMLFLVMILPAFPLKPMECNDIYRSLAANSPLMYAMMHISVYALYSAMWTAGGLALSSLLPDRYVALGAPLILGYVLEEITLKLPSFLNLYKLSHCYPVFSGTGLQNYLFTIALFLLISALFGWMYAHFLKRRIRNEMV